LGSNDFRRFLESVFDAESKKNIFKNLQEQEHSVFCRFCQKTWFWGKLGFFKDFAIFDYKIAYKKNKK
jgi:hypothetical protein